MSHKRKNNKLDFTKIKNFCISKHSFNKVLSGARGWEKIFANDATDKALISKIYKQLMQLNIKKTTQSKNGQKT